MTYMNVVRLAMAGTAILAAGCTKSVPGSALASPETRAYFPAYSDERGMQDYRISAFDEINVTVFQVKDLSVEKVQVDASGRILFPLIGSVQAAGRTSSELSADIAAKLRERYMEAPQVSVTVAKSVTQKVTVEGSVNEAGVYELQGQTSLLQAVAMAKGPSRVASLPNVAIFRRVNGKRMAAVFDLKAIREGSMEDPQIQGDDIVVVGLDNVKGAFREVISALPAFAVFTPLTYN